MIEQIAWCNVCNSRPADGVLTVEIEGQEEEIDACEPCVHDETKVRFQ